MATTYKVVWGDTLTSIAKRYNTTVNKLVQLNDIEDPDYIVVGQVLQVDGTATKTTNKTSKPTIKAFGLQSKTDRTVYVSWKWDKTNTDHYKVKWYYATGDGIAFIGEDTTVTAKQSLYTAPSNATKIRVIVKPVSKKRTVNKKETYYWTANWSTEKTYAFVNNPPSTPSSAPEVKIEKLKLTASLDNIDAKALNATEIEFKIFKFANEKYTTFKTGKATIKNGYASFSCNVSAGYEYTASCRAVRGKEVSGWTDRQSTLAGTAPSAPSRITTCEASSLDAILVEWPKVKNATKYELEYTEEKRYFDKTDSVTRVECSKNAWEVLGLETGKEYFFRVRAVNDQGESAWTSVVSTVLGTGPAAPTTWSSAQSITVGDTLVLYWIHNSEDGSKQTSAQIELTAPDGYPEIHTLTIDDSDEESTTTQTSTEKPHGYNVQTSNYTEGAQLYWRVRTRGILDEETWNTQSWDGMANPERQYIWSDKKNIYYSNGSTQYALDGDAWVEKVWGSLYPANGTQVWTDGKKYFYSSGTTHYILEGNTWEIMTWSGLTNFYGNYIWSDGKNTYYSNSNTQYVLGENDTWAKMTWNGFTPEHPQYIWNYGENYCYSDGSNQYMLGEDNTWNDRTWEGLTEFYGTGIWIDNANVRHYSDGAEHYALKDGSWVAEEWKGLSRFYGQYIWTDGVDIFYSNGSTQKALIDVYGKWSVERLVNIYAEPQLFLTMETKDGNEIDILDSYPFYVSATPTPDNQTPLSYHVTITYDPDDTEESDYDTSDSAGNLITVNKGDEVYSKYYDTSARPMLLEISAGSVTLENNKRYKLSCIVAMDSGLTAENEVEFTVAWSDDNEYEPNAEISVDENTFATYIRPYCEDENGNAIENLALTVYRCNSDGSFTAINDIPIENGKNEFITDPHPALNYARYRVVAQSLTNGNVTYCDLPNYPIGGKSVVIQWDEEWAPFDTDNQDALEASAWTGSMLILPYNIDVSDTPNPDVSLVEYIGRKHPVSYYGTQLGETSTWSVAIPKTDEETLYGIRRLAVWQGDVYVREPSGSGYWANIKVSYSQAHADPVIPVTFDVTRVEGGV